MSRVTLRGRYRRSVDLTRDVRAETALDGYVVTATARATLARIAQALDTPDAARAWSIIGPYGGGKSAFALFAAHLLERRDDAWARLHDANPDLADRLDHALDAPLAAVLVGGQREGLPRALARGLAQAATDGPFADALAPVRDDALALLDRLVPGAQADDEAVLDLFERATDAVHAASGGGLIVVVDELGKLLEYAALDPAGGDLFLLQRLAERAARSHDGPPLLVATVLHQAFERYAGRLSTAQREEWRKVQGRFEDVPYAEPVDETLRLLAEAIEADAPSEAEATVESVLDAIRLPARIDRAEAADRLARALPLHPAVALLVGPLFRRMAQNERTLFAFLASGEPGSFLRVLDAPEAPPTYRLDHLFDYLTDALGASLAHGDTGRLWAETQSALLRLPDADPLQVRLLKTVALLNFAGEPAGLLASPALLRASVDAEEEEVDAALDALVAARVAVFHRSMGLYRVWQGSDFDVEARLTEARATLPEARPLAAMLAEALPPEAVVARRHSYLTGTTRAFAVEYATEDSWRDALRRFRENAEQEEEGLIIYVLPENIEPSALLDALPTELEKEASGEMVFAAVPYGARALRETVREWLALDHLVEMNKSALKGDETARHEIAARKRALDARVQDGFARLIEVDEEGRIPCSWVRPSGKIGRLTGRALQTLLSDACDDRFHETAVVWNELVNRRSPSSSAMSGLKSLLVAMLEDGDKPDLGFEGYPAGFGLYVSIVQTLGMHGQDDGGTWTFFPPDAEHEGSRAAWDTLVRHLREAKGKPVSVDELYAALAAPPHGMRAGLYSIFLVALLLHHESEVAVYYDGRFLPSFGLAEVELLLKVPEKFTLQWVALDVERRGIVEAVAPIVGVDAAEHDPLPVVVGLIRRARDLPAYAQTTSELSDRAIAVRETLRHATEPASLLFEDLPEACDLTLNALVPSAFAERLAEALADLEGAYPALLERIERDVTDRLRISGPTLEGRRATLVERARPLLPLTTHTALKAFLVRALDERLETTRWVESIGAVLGKRPPALWVDADKETFAANLQEVARRFHTLEPLAFGTSGEEAGDGAVETSGVNLRVGITQPYTPELEGVVRLSSEEEEHVDHLASEIERLINVTFSDLSLDAQIAAVARVMQRLLSHRNADA